MRAAVVILNWNTREYLQDFVPGVLAALGPDDALYVADSASRDDSLDFLRENYPQVGLLPLEENFGFAGGYNRALSALQEREEFEYYLLLNSDVQLSPHSLEPLYSWMEAHRNCGICGPKLHALVKNTKESAEDKYLKLNRFEYAGAAGGYIDRLGYPYCRGRVLKRVEPDEGQYDSPKRVFWVSGACLLIRSSLWEALGGFDDSFFAHMEEIDLCWRAQALGSEVWTVPDALVWHLGGGTLPNESAWKLELNYRNSLWMLQKNLPAAIGPMRAKCRIALRWMLDWGSALVYLLSGKPQLSAAVVRAHRQVRRSPAWQQVPATMCDSPAANCQSSAAEHGSPSQENNNISSEHHSPAPERVCILFQALVRGKGIFKYLRKYEGSY
ncbi:MAG: glycosyltransferase family 2 protein [Candidatus Cryptobacteroides sp.]